MSIKNYVIISVKQINIPMLTCLNQYRAAMSEWLKPSCV